VTWWDLIALLGAFVGAAAAVFLFRRPPRVIGDLAENEVHVQPGGVVHLVPPGELAAHVQPAGLLMTGEPPRPTLLAVDCDCRPRREILRTVPVFVHRPMGRRR